MGIIFNGKSILTSNYEECSCEDQEFLELEKYMKGQHTFLKNIFEIIKGTGEELFEVLKYFMIGVLIASTVQVLLPRSILTYFNANPIVSIVVLMLFAYLISLCSNSDSFVGRSLLPSFGSSGVVAYLILGPMIDIKNTIVLFGNYTKKFVLCLIGLIFLFVFLISLVVTLL